PNGLPTWSPLAPAAPPSGYPEPVPGTPPSGPPALPAASSEVVSPPRPRAPAPARVPPPASPVLTSIGLPSGPSTARPSPAVPVPSCGPRDSAPGSSTVDVVATAPWVPPTEPGEPTCGPPLAVYRPSRVESPGMSVGATGACGDQVPPRAIT